jgi:hypothetical protein
VDRRDVDVVEKRDVVSLCQSVKAVWERERRLDARSARPFLLHSVHISYLSNSIHMNQSTLQTPFLSLQP